MKEKIVSLICEAYKEVLDLQAVDHQKPKKVDESIPIYGNRGYLDSLGLVTLVVAIGEKVQKEFNLSVSIATEKAMSRKTSPFKDVKSLSLYLLELIREKTNG